MQETAGQRQPLNPLSSSCVRPGAIEFQFAPGPGLDQLLLRLQDTTGWGEIVGPHGSGKSTLLQTLIPHLMRSQFRPILFELHDGQRRLPPGWKDIPPRGQRPVIVVDGFEQLSVLGQWNVRHVCQRRQWGLLITAHQTMGLPTLYRTRTTPVLAESLVEQLCAQRPLSIPPSEIRASFQRHRGNLRDVFMDLFDRYENLRR